MVAPISKTVVKENDRRYGDEEEVNEFIQQFKKNPESPEW